MNVTTFRSWFLATALFLAGALTYQLVDAEDGPQQSSSDMRGTYFIFTENDQHSVKALDDPAVRSIGDRLFLYGRISGKTGDIIKDSPFTGSTGYVPVDSITAIQEVKVD